MKALSIIFYFITSIAIHAMYDELNCYIAKHKNNQIKLVKLLERMGFCSNLTPDLEAAKKILSHVNTINYEDRNIQNKLSDALYWAVVNKHTQFVELLLDYNVNIVGARPYDLPLHSAAEDGYNDILKLLIAHGAHVNTQDAHGSTSLMLAAQFNKLEAVKLLLNAGADTTIKDNAGKTALIFAQEEPHINHGGLYKRKEIKEKIIKLLQNAAGKKELT